MSQLGSEHSENIFTILHRILDGNLAFAVGKETTTWTHGLRFTIYDVRSSTSAAYSCPFDAITWDIEEALRDSGYPVTALMKGERLCMLDVDCRAANAALTAQQA